MRVTPKNGYPFPEDGDLDPADNTTVMKSDFIGPTGQEDNGTLVKNDWPFAKVVQLAFEELDIHDHVDNESALDVLENRIEDMEDLYDRIKKTKVPMPEVVQVTQVENEGFVIPGATGSNSMVMVQAEEPSYISYDEKKKKWFITELIRKKAEKNDIIGKVPGKSYRLTVFKFKRWN